MICEKVPCMHHYIEQLLHRVKRSFHLLSFLPPWLDLKHLLRSTASVNELISDLIRQERNLIISKTSGMMIEFK